MVAILAFPASSDFRPLLDGISLKGWHIQGQGEWVMRDGMLVGTHRQSDKEFGHLVSDSAYVDFTFRYRWKLLKGNSGLYFRSTEGGTAGMIGPQVEMDGLFPGGIYATNTDPWGWITQPNSEDVKKWWKPNEWNLVTVTAAGAKVTVTYNGFKTAETSDARLPRSGHFGFQVHGNDDCEFFVEDVEIETPSPVTLVLPRAAPMRFRGTDARDFLGRLDGQRTVSKSGSPLPLVGRNR